MAQIVTFGTMAARNAVRDVGRVMGLPYQDVDKVAKLIPMELKMTLRHALEVSPDLKKLYENDEKIHELIDTAIGVEGMPRHASTHAAGVVITREPATEYVPLSTNDGLPVTQFNMTEIERLGLLKMDFLGPAHPDRHPRHRGRRPAPYPGLCRCQDRLRRPGHLRHADQRRDRGRVPAGIHRHAARCSPACAPKIWRTSSP